MKSASSIRLAIISDVHYASAAEKARGETFLSAVPNPFRRWLVKQYRHRIWLRDAFGHNHHLDHFLTATRDSDFAVANGDFECDTAYVGVSDEAAFQSASECLGKLRTGFPGRFQGTFGDHEIGKKMLAADVGGLRLASFTRAQTELGLQPFWQVRFGRVVLLGVTSTLAAMPVYEAESLPDEIAEWRRLSASHLAEIDRAFAALDDADRVILFCHDPTALPFIGRLPAVRRRFSQIERTVIGHLHSLVYLRMSRALSGMPSLAFLGHSIRRMSLALREARHWKPFNVLLCPSPPGVQMLKDGGYFIAALRPDGSEPVRFEFHPLPW